MKMITVSGTLLHDLLLQLLQQLQHTATATARVVVVVVRTTMVIQQIDQGLLGRKASGQGGVHDLALD